MTKDNSYADDPTFFLKSENTIDWLSKVFKFFQFLSLKYDISKCENLGIGTLKGTVSDWDSMSRVITQTRGQAFQTLSRAF